MEARVSAVEAAIVRIDSKLEVLVEGQQKIAVEIAELKGRVSQLPTTIQMLGFVLAVLAAGGFLRHFFP